MEGLDDSRPRMVGQFFDGVDGGWIRCPNRLVQSCQLINPLE